MRVNLFLPLIPNYKSLCSDFTTTMGIASLPCSGYVQIGAPSPDKRAAGCTQNLGPPATTKTTQVNARSTNRNSRHADTTSTVPRARSGWSGFKFSGFMILLPGPIGRRLGDVLKS